MAAKGFCAECTWPKVGVTELDFLEGVAVVSTAIVRGSLVMSMSGAFANVIG